MTDRIAIVAISAEHANRLREDLDPKEETFKFIYLGQSIQGYRFSHILLSEHLREVRFFASDYESAKINQWMDELELRRSATCPPAIYI